LPAPRRDSAVKARAARLRNRTRTNDDTITNRAWRHSSQYKGLYEHSIIGASSAHRQHIGETHPTVLWMLVVAHHPWPSLRLVWKQLAFDCGWEPPGGLPGSLQQHVTVWACCRCKYRACLAAPPEAFMPTTFCTPRPTIQHALRLMHADHTRHGDRHAVKRRRVPGGPLQGGSTHMRTCTSATLCVTMQLHVLPASTETAALVMSC
jgi:hypothetical protein